jgi:FtsP/CotA-like multicopper oxidase with cupredoxin domain
MMAMPEEGVPAVAHLHGGEVEPGSDGGPISWFTQGFAEKGPGWQYETFTYPNQQLPTTLWYHDHALGITRLNVYAGLAGFYLLRDPSIEVPLNLPNGAYEIPLVIQDRMFFTNGQLMYPVGGDNPEIHPIWQPEFFGNTILVNGKAWPYLSVEPRKYRFRFLDGSNSRFYALKLFKDATGAPGPAFWQIGSDGGYLDAPVLLNDPADPNARRLVLGPGERADVIVDFSGYAVGTAFTLKNNAKSPFPNGAIADPQTVGQIMRFRVVESTGPDNSSIATPGAGYVTRLGGATHTRQLTLDELMGPNGPIMAMINMTHFDEPATELPEVGSTEVWEFINTTGDAHPVHLHLVQYQLVNRQKFQVNRYARARANSPSMDPPDVTPYLVGRPTPPNPEEAGWKDTFKMLPGEVTRVIVRFKPQDEGEAFAFDATAEPGYVYHCHILEHEDNDMMRPYKLQAPLVTQKPVDLSAARASSHVGVVRIALLQNAPNPASGATAIGFALPAPAKADLRVYDLLGREVRVLVQGEFAAGQHTVTWDGLDAAGRKLPQGIYPYRLHVGSTILTRKAALAW